MSYSQNNEERVILDYFRGEVGTFLDIGANDGRTFSNTLALTERGWNGVLIEPSPQAFERLKKEYEYREGFELVNVAIGKSNGITTFYESGELVSKQDVALVSTMIPKEKERWKPLNMSWNEILVELRDFETFLLEREFKRFDFLSIDIEGMELDVLPQIKFMDLGIRLACIEFNGKFKWRYDAIMEKEGFELIHKNLENLIYGRK